MKFTKLTVVAAALALVTIPVVADEASDAIEARKAAMKIIAANTKTLGGMAGGAMAFDATEAQAAAAAIAEQAALLPGLFELQATAHNSKAKPEIWSDFSGFTAKAADLQAAAEALSGAASAADVGAGMAGIGGSCQSCHMSYRL